MEFLACHHVAQLHRTAQDALKSMVAGASTIQIGSASFVPLNTVQQVAKNVEQWWLDIQITDVKSVIDAL